jgi:hypothetical protein
VKANYIAAFFAMCAPLLAIAKGPTRKITIKGSDLASPIEITEKGILEKFNVWTGAGVTINGLSQTKGFIVDWEKGPVTEPQTTLRRYEVLFDVIHHRPRGRGGAVGKTTLPRRFRIDIPMAHLSLMPKLGSFRQATITAYAPDRNTRRSSRAGWYQIHTSAPFLRRTVGSHPRRKLPASFPQ